ncbi:MAG: HAMP domain-containing histidine kinase [gamma proteobacterium symbiont of Taylorina sp.]|nr:HAMP domain-containing histidine kinase [gamma proteobacterium symbiont of Taylorina sp.]
MKYSSKLTIISLQKNVANYIESYSINEYEKLVLSDMGHKDIFAIIVQNYNMGKITGTSSYISGKIRDSNWNVIDFDPENSEQIKQLEQSYYSDKYDITTPSGSNLGTIAIYSSDRFINKELNYIVTVTLIKTITISLLFIILLFLTIRHFVLKPISDIVSVISHIDKDGIPIEFIPTIGSSEIFMLASTMNSMINSIRAANILLKKQKEELYKLNHELEQQVIEEVSKRMKQEQILIQQSKLTAMGEMVGSIAHQWRQPLDALNVNIENLEFDYEDGLIDKEFLDKFIVHQTDTLQYMSKTIDDFRNFFRIDKEKTAFSVKEAIEKSVIMQSAHLKNYGITLMVTGNDFIVDGFNSEFQQVIMNLISNAKDAILETKQKDGIIDISLKDNKVTIKDNGAGIPDDLITRIFEPYYTTKEQGKGTGMGLYMSKMIIEGNMNGKISVLNSGGGTNFIIDLG